MSTQGSIHTAARDMTIVEANKSSADAITEAIALPLARTFGNFAAELVESKLSLQTQELKANVRTDNIKRHLEKVAEFSDKTQVERPRTIEETEYLEEGIKYIQDVSPDDEPIATMWQKWMAEVLSCSYDMEHQLLLDSLKQIDRFDAQMIKDIAQEGHTISRRIAKFRRLEHLTQLDLVRKIDKGELRFYKRKIDDMLNHRSHFSLKTLCLAFHATIFPNNFQQVYVLTTLGEKLFSYYSPTSSNNVKVDQS